MCFASKLIAIRTYLSLHLPSESAGRMPTVHISQVASFQWIAEQLLEADVRQTGEFVPPRNRKHFTPGFSFALKRLTRAENVIS